MMRTERRHEQCLNCGTATPGHFCPECGQRNTDLHASIWELALDILGEAFEADSRMARTVVPFLFQPGFLTNEYNAGRRVGYSSPLRLYLFASFTFFLVLGFAPHSEDESKFRGSVTIGSADGGAIVVGNGNFVSSGRDGGQPQRARGESDGGSDGGVLSALANAGEPDQPLDGGLVVQGLGAIGHRFEEKARTIQSSTGERRAELVERIRNETYSDASKAFFLLVPLFALLLKLLYWRRRRYYVEHLTLAFHLHAFSFLVLVPQLLLGGLASLAAVLVILAYLFVALRKVYGQGRLKTALKLAALLLVHLVFVSLCIGAAAAIGFLTA
jgi:hypothetical protein